MTTILEIQKLDAQKRKARASVNNSKENKLLIQFTNVMKEGRNFINAIAKASSELVNEYNDLYNKYQTNKGKAEITAKQKVEGSNDENLSTFIDATNSLASDCAIIEQKLRDVKDKSTKLLNDYNVAMNQLKNTKQKVDTLKDMVNKMQENLTPQLAEIDAKIKALEPKVDDKIYATYTKMRDDNIFPVFVTLNGNRCGGCQMELPLSFIDKLKLKGTLPCEECHRIILFENNKN